MQAAQAVDTIVMIAGAVCALGMVIWLARDGRWRNPLAGIAPAHTPDARAAPGPTILHPLVVLCLYFGLGMLLMHAVIPPGDTEFRQPGSHRWHLAQGADAVAKLPAAALMIWILRRFRPFAPEQKNRQDACSSRRPTRGSAAASAPGHRLRPAALIGSGLLAGLLAISVCTVQLHLTTHIWERLHPGEVPPVHPVLLAVEASVWGLWGKIQLLVSAVLVAAVAEELFFRGVLLQMLWRYTGRAWISIVVSAIGFGLIHPQATDILPLVTFGLILGFVRLRTRSLTACIIAHALFNARSMLLAVFFPELVSSQ